MARLSQAAVDEALNRLDGSLPGQFKSMWLRAWLVSKRIEALGHKPSIALVKDVVRDYFVIRTAEREGIINPFMESNRQLYWASIPTDGKAGRTNVWDYATRSGKARVLFSDDHMGSGLREDSVDILMANLEGGKVPSISLATFLLRDQVIPTNADADVLTALLKERFGITDEDFARITGTEDWTSPLSGEPSYVAERLADNRLPPLESPSELPARPALLIPPSSSIKLPDEVWGMVRRALVKYRALMLVGPPGTGKTQIVRQLHQEATNDPSKFGLAKPPGELMTRTLDDSWTSLDLVGGRSIVGGTLRFVPGALLQAIQEDRWLLLDEINRADVDRIFGALLTWLSGEETGVGRLLEDATAPEVKLGWSEVPESLCEPADSPADTVRYLAGNDFRLLGTYNAQDAHRVFRFGDALGRRFVRVPISEPSGEDFRRVLDGRYPSLADDVKDALTKIYSSHASPDPSTVLGPAIFLQMAEYLVPGAEEAEQTTWMREAYLINAGPFVMRYGIAQEGLRDRIVNSGALSEADWLWITAHGRHLI